MITIKDKHVCRLNMIKWIHYSGNMIMVIVSILIMLSISHVLQYVHAFHPNMISSNSRNHHQVSTINMLLQSSNTRLNKRKQTSSTTSLYVFERMSEECIAAIVTAQKQTNLYQLEYVDRQAMLLGCIDQSQGTKAFERTLKQYQMTWRLSEKTFKLINTVTDDNDNSDNNKAGWLSGFVAASKSKDGGDSDRPFSKELRITFTNAGKIASQMGSPTIHVHHIFLSLLEYKEAIGKDGIPSATDSVYDVNTNTPWYLMKKMNILDDHITPLIICQSLLTNLQSYNNEMDNGNNNKELVSGMGGSSSTKTPTLQDYGTDLTQLAADGLLDPIYGRDQEIKSCIRTLIRRRKNNVCLIGEPGVGKTAIAEGIAQILIDEKKCPTPLQGYRIISIQLSNLVAGTRYRGEFEERLQSIIQEVMNPKTPNTILFIDEIHTLIGAGSASEGGNMDAANILKPSLARGDVQIIGATTIAEYRKYIEKDTALERRLQPLLIKEPTVEQTIQILSAVQKIYEKHHRVTYTPSALNAAAILSERYINDRFLPDKALDLLDEAGALAQLEYLDGLEELNDSDDDEKPLPMVTEHTIAEVMSEWSGIPIGKIETNEVDRLFQLEATMTRRVKGQSRAIKSVARAIRRSRSGLRDPKRPIVSLLFSGPTGTGKTLLCKTIAETYYGAEKDIIRIDMSEYMEKHTTARLTGPPPGYIGYDAGGQLTEAVRKSPHSVVLFDEIEKAHEDVLNILLQVMEDGILTDGKGRTVNFKNTIIVMTSNVGSRRIVELCKRKDDTVTTPNTVSAESNTISVLPNFSTSTSSLSTPTMNGNSAITEPMKPEEMLKKMKNNPKAASIIMKSATDPDIMNAVRVAMNGSPADLFKEAQKNPTIASFLQEVWSALEDDDNTKNDSSTNASVSKPSGTTGLDAISTSFQETISTWNHDTKDVLAAEIINQLELPDISDNDVGEDNDDIVDHVLYPELIDVVKEELEINMRPEFLNRIDEIIVFSPLSTRNLQMIAKLTVDSITQRAKSEHKLEEIIVQPCLLERIRHDGSYNADQFGARPMRRAAQRYIEDSLSDAILSGFLQLNNNAKETKISLSMIQSSSLGQNHCFNGKERVAIQRMSDGKIMEIEIEDASGGIGGAPPPVSSSSSNRRIQQQEQYQTNGENINGPMLQTELI